MSNSITCPFCCESDFDLIGLKSHFGWCDAFDAIQAVSNPMIEPRACAPAVTIAQVNAAAEAIAKRYTVGKGGIAVIAAIITRNLAATTSPSETAVGRGVRKCVKCGHDKYDGRLKLCIATTGLDDYGSERCCGCECVPPPTGDDAGLSRKLYSEAETLIDAIRDADLDAIEGVFATLDDEELKVVSKKFAAALRSGKES